MAHDHLQDLEKARAALVSQRRTWAQTIASPGEIPENAIRAINEAGLYYYLEKPWSNDHLKLVIRNGVERSTLFAELDRRVQALEGAHKELHDIRRRLVQAFL